MVRVRFDAAGPIHRALSLARRLIPRLRTPVVVMLLTMLSTAPVRAQTPNQAGLIIVSGDGSVSTRCVQFDAESISGYELLERSGLELRMEVSGMGPTICAIDQEGCAAGEHCFCRCLSSPCVYWSYWRLGDEGWSYSSMGAGNTTVTDGTLDAWVWGEGNMQKGTAQQPPDLTLDAICSAPAVSEDAAPDIPIADTTADAVTTGWAVEFWEIALVLGAPLPAVALWWFVRRTRRQT